METTLKKITELAAAAGVDRGTVHAWKRNDLAFPKRTAKGWDRAAFIAYARRKLEQAAHRQGGENAELKATKLRKQCDLLDVELQRAEIARQTEALQLSIAQGKTIDREEMLGHVRALCQIIQDGFAQAVALTKVRTADARALKVIEDVRNEVLKRILNKVEGAE